MKMNWSLDNSSQRRFSIRDTLILSTPNEVEAVEVMEGHSGLIDLLLTDMVMPIM